MIVEEEATFRKSGTVEGVVITIDNVSNSGNVLVKIHISGMSVTGATRGFILGKQSLIVNDAAGKDTLNDNMFGGNSK